MILFKLGLKEESQRDFDEISKQLSLGKIAAIPTETFYALSTNPFQEKSVQRVFSIKGRSSAKPILLLIANQRDVFRLSNDIPTVFETLAHAFWPGPLTLVLKASEAVPDWIARGTGKVALRIPGNPLTHRILKNCSIPLTGTSANRSGESPLISDEEVLQHLSPHLDLLVMGGVLPGGPPSTLLDITAKTPQLLRAGKIKKEDIEKILKRRIVSAL